MIHWYDIVPDEPEKYGCPHLYYTKEYNIIPIEFIDQEEIPIPAHSFSEHKNLLPGWVVISAPLPFQDQ